MISVLLRIFWIFSRWFLFRFDAERIHDLTHGFLRFLGRGRKRRLLLQVTSGSLPGVNRKPTPDTPMVLGMSFRSRVGLAAGFDKNAELLSALPSLGFGFAEIGTVTPLPQKGNPWPRLLRDAPHRSLFNRMGFNGQGVDRVSENLKQARLSGVLPLGFRIGVNLGKNKDTPSEEAHRDYAKAASPFEYLADYLVINVSSPNTPGLRDLQSVEALKKIIGSVQKAISGWKKASPILLKLAPELQGAQLTAILSESARMGISGFICTNTLGGSYEKNARFGRLSGGWSGAVLTERSFQALREARSITRLPILSVGGIMGEQDAKERIKAGADLIQVYTGWIYRGPTFARDLTKALSEG